MLLGLLCLAASTAVMAFNQSYAALALGRFIQGISSGSIWVLGLALLADFTKEDSSDAGKTMAVVFAAYTAGSFVGPIVGGYLYELGNYVPFLSVIVFTVLDAILRLMLVDPMTEKNEELSPPKRSFKEILSSIMRNRLLWLILALIAACGVVVGGSEVSFTLQFQQYYNLSTGQTGLGFLAVLLPQLVASGLGGAFYDRFGFRATVIPGVILMSLTNACLAIPALSLVLFLTIIAISSFVAMFGLSPLMPSIMKVVEKDSYGFAYGLFNCAFAVGLLCGPPLASFLFQFTSFQVYQIVVAIFVMLNLPLALLYQDPISNPISNQETLIEMQEDLPIIIEQDVTK